MKLNPNGEFDKNFAPFVSLQRMYNNSIKNLLDLPGKAANEMINIALGHNSLQNIIMKNYRSNSFKWREIYHNDMAW